MNKYLQFLCNKFFSRKGEYQMELEDFTTYPQGREEEEGEEEKEEEEEEGN